MTDPDHRDVGTYEASLADIRSVPLNELHGLSVLVGWPHRETDWELLREVGQGVAALDEIGRVIGSAMWFPCDAAHATVGMVITVPRLQANGAGLWLTREVLRQAGDRRLRLNATRAARRLYAHLHFRNDRAVHQRQGYHHPPHDRLPAPDGTMEPLGPDDLSALLELDAAAFGARRNAIIRAVLARSIGYGLRRDGVLVAFALCRAFGRGHVIGPVVAGTDGDALAVVGRHLQDHPGEFMRLDTFAEDTPFTDFLESCGLVTFDKVVGMSLGDPPWGAPPGTIATYALASQALG